VALALVDPSNKHGPILSILFCPDASKWSTTTAKNITPRLPLGHHQDASELYPAWTTPVGRLKDFGVGVAVYFETLLSLSIICLIAGLLYLPSIHYYGSDGCTSQHVNTLLGPLRRKSHLSRHRLGTLSRGQVGTISRAIRDNGRWPVRLCSQEYLFTVALERRSQPSPCRDLF
jgi:hypothetical protein